MNILIIDELEKFEGLPFDFLQKDEFRIIHRTNIKQLQTLTPDIRPELIIINFADVRDNSGHFIRKMKSLFNTPLLGILHVINDLQIAVASALGVDDCVFYPCSSVEITARVKALTRPSVNNQLYVGQIKKIGPLEINLDKFEVKRGDQLIQLTRTEFSILSILASNPDKVFLKEEMYQKLWNDKYYDNGNALNVHIRRLRKKLEVKPDQPELIITKWGIGYKFEA
jgi:two-component system, OmpR family, response regulator VicR